MNYVQILSRQQECSASLYDMLQTTSRAPRAIRCTCGAELADTDTRYRYKGYGLMGCHWCIDAHDRTDDPCYTCDCRHFDPLTTQTVYTARGSDRVLGCSACIDNSNA